MPNVRLLRAGVFNLTGDLQALADEYTQLYPVEVLQQVLSRSLSNPDFDVSSLLPSGVSFMDPQFFHDQAVNVSSSLQVHLAASPPS